jgi:hypothetical protein
LGESIGGQGKVEGEGRQEIGEERRDEARRDEVRWGEVRRVESRIQGGQDTR